MTIEQEPMSNKDAKIEECKFFKKVYLGKHCELFKSPCYGTACNFHKEFIKLTQLESENNRLREALGRIAKNRTEYTCDYMECECWNWADAALKGE